LQIDDAFMVLDCGGGTVDITLHNVKTTNPLSVDEIAPPSGGPWGSTYVDEKFIEFVEGLIGKAKMAEFKKSSYFLELMDSWESVKTSFDGFDTRAKSINLSPLLEVLDDVNIKELVEEHNVKMAPAEYVCSIPTSIMTDPVVAADGHTYDRKEIETWLEMKKTSPLTNERLPHMNLVPNLALKKLIDGFTEKCVRVRGRSTVLFPTATIAGFFNEVITCIGAHVADLVSQHSQLKYIYLAGGFAESRFLCDKMRADFEKDGLKLIVPQRPSTAVIRGAVMLGVVGAADPSRVVFASRRARFTYGVNSTTRFDPLLHAGRSIALVVDGVKRVDIFKPLVKAGMLLQRDQQIESQTFSALHEHHTEVGFGIYASTATDPKWLDDPTLNKIGSVKVPCSKALNERVKLTMQFGSTEIKVAAINVHTGASTDARLDYDFGSI
jgi:hypothetical protein